MASLPPPDSGGDGGSVSNDPNALGKASRVKELSRRALGHTKEAGVVLVVGVVLSIVVALTTKHLARSQVGLEVTPPTLAATTPLGPRVDAVLAPPRLAAMATDLRLYPSVVEELGPEGAGNEMRKHIALSFVSDGRATITFEDSDREVAQRVAQRLAEAVASDAAQENAASAAKVVDAANAEAKAADQTLAHANEALAAYTAGHPTVDADAAAVAAVAAVAATVDAAAPAIDESAELTTAVQDAKHAADAATAKLDAAMREVASGTGADAARVAITAATLPPEESRSGLLFAGFALSLAVAIAFAFGRVALSDTLVDAGDVEGLGLLPVLGVVPRLVLGPPTPGAPPPNASNARGRASEEGRARGL